MLKLVQETPEGTGGGVVVRETTLFAPQANPELKDEQFRFAVPNN